MGTFSALLTLCAGNSPGTGEFPAQRPVTWSFDVFFDLRLNKRLSKQCWGWWVETPSRSLWRHSNEEKRSHSAVCLWDALGVRGLSCIVKIMVLVIYTTYVYICQVIKSYDTDHLNLYKLNLHQVPLINTEASQVTGWQLSISTYLIVKIIACNRRSVLRSGQKQHRYWFESYWNLFLFLVIQLTKVRHWLR